MSRRMPIAELRQLVAHAIDRERRSAQDMSGDTNPQVETMRLQALARAEAFDAVHSALLGDTVLLRIHAGK